MAVYQNILDAGWLGLLRAGASDVWDFTRDQYLRGGQFLGTGGAGLTVTRASDGYAETASGTLVNFGSGVLRRTDRGVLVEGARTNLLLRSQEFNDGYWTKQRSSATANATTAPDGTLTAEKIVEDTTVTNSHDLRRSVSVTNGTVYTISIFAKAAERTWCAIFASFSSATSTTSFDLGAGVVGTVSANATATMTALANGWYRCTITVTANASSGAVFFYLATGDGIAGTSYTGDGTSGAFFWGAQLEEAAFASSYIPTVASTVTRAADQVTVTLSALTSGYSMYAQWSGSQNGGSRVIDFGGSTLIRRSGGTNLNFNGAGLEGSAVGAFASGKAAIAIDAAAVRGAANGSSVTVTTGSYSSSSQTALRFGSTGTSNYLDGYIRRIAIFPSALSAAQLQAITT
jgi:hypothetical protein